MSTDDLADATRLRGEGRLKESAAALDCLSEIVAEFHADGGGRASSAWLERVRHNWRTLGPQVTAARMVADYQRQLYGPLLAAQRP